MCHNIFTISLCIHCTYNVNLYCRHKKRGKFCTHLEKFVQYLPFFVQMCIILTTFVYLQCKLTLQVQSKHIKILKKTNTKTKLKPTGILEGKKRKEKKRKSAPH